MEINREALEQLSIADLIALQGKFNNNSQSKDKDLRDYAESGLEYVEDELVKRMNNIFII